MATASNLCEICKKSTGRYTCPRCNVFYCSTTCYQSNGHVECSESFFKDCVDEMLHSVDKNSSNKKDMEELLKRVNDLDDLDKQLLDSDDEDDVEPLERRLKDIDLDDSETVWSRLTAAEKAEYFEFLRTADLSRLDVRAWQPFWTEKFDGKVVELDEIEKLRKRCPELTKIKDFDKISRKQPADCVRYNLINILASYVFTVRYFDGDHFKEAEEAVKCISEICSVFKSNSRFETYEEALKSVVYEYKNLNSIETTEENDKLLESDLKHILDGPHTTEGKFYILCCLSDLSRLFKSVLKRKQSQENTEFTDNVKMNVKKLDYYLSYVKDVYTS